MEQPEVTANKGGVTFSWGSIAKCLVVAASLGFTATTGWLAAKQSERTPATPRDRASYQVADVGAIRAIEGLGESIKELRQDVRMQYEKLNLAIERLAKLEGAQSKRNSGSMPSEMSLLVPTMGVMP